MANNFPQPETVLLIAAHPDDPEFGAGATVAKWTQAGVKIIFVIVTDGSKGSAELDMTMEKLVAMREDEQRAAAKVLGVEDVIFLKQPDGQTRNTEELREMIVRQIRTYKPDLIITHDPTARIINNQYPNHTDHRVVGDTVLDAVFPLARDRLNFPEHEEEGLETHKTFDVFLIFTNEPNMWVDVSDTVDIQIKALLKHKSQISEPDKLEERIITRAALRAEKVSFEYAEVFRWVKLQR